MIDFRNPHNLSGSVLAALTFAICLGFPSDSSAKPITDCNTNLSEPLGQLFFILDQSSSINTQSLDCRSVEALNNLDFATAEVTTSRSRGQSIICITGNREVPCQHHIASVDESIDASIALKDALGYQEVFDPNAPLEETVARLFIKPSKYIWKSRKNTNEDDNSDSN